MERSIKTIHINILVPVSGYSFKETENIIACCFCIGYFINFNALAGE